MSKRAEELALEAYPVDICGYTVECRVGAKPQPQDWNEVHRTHFQEGYEQAEKDLGWHSVDESLPEETEYVTDNGCHQKWSKSVLVITTGNSVMLCWTKDGEFFCDKDFHFPVKVKYWMPMPKLPNEDE